MKRALLIIFYILGLFLLIAVAVLPEYRYRVLAVCAFYLAVFIVLLRYTAKNEIVSFYHVVFGKRFKYLIPGIIIFAAIVLAGLVFLNVAPFTTTKFDMTSKGSISVSASSSKLIEQLNRDVEVIYILPMNKEDYKSYFNALMEEFRDHNRRIGYKTLHPVLNTLEYNRLKNKAASLVPGNFVVISGDNYLVGETINEKSIARAINRVVNGDISICYSKGHGEPELSDLSEKGGGVMYSMLVDRGVVLAPVTSDEWDKCEVLFIADPSAEFSDDEITKLEARRNGLVIFGGADLSSLKKFLLDKGIKVTGKQNVSFKEYALRDYDGGVLLDTFYEHPILNGIKGGVVSAYGYSIDCPSCQTLASANDSPLYIGKDNLLLFTGEKSVTNFFMRFNGNLKLIYNALFFSFAPDAYMLFTDDKNDEPGLFAVSPRYLSIIFWMCVVGIPVLFLLLGVYCFKNIKISKVK